MIRFINTPRPVPQKRDHRSTPRRAWWLLCALLSMPVLASQPTKAKPEKTIQPDDLKRLAFERGGALPWTAKQTSRPKEKPKDPEEDGNALNLSADDLIVVGHGPFSMGAKDTKDGPRQIISLTGRVTITAPGSNFTLRGDEIKAVQNLETGALDFMEAKRAIEIILPDLQAKGHFLRYEVKYDKYKKRIKDQVIIRGDKENKKPATLWSGGNTIQSYMFILDLRLNTYRAQGGALAEIQLPKDPNAQPKKENPKATSLPKMSISGGGTLLFACDGELLLEGATGQVRIHRNAYIRKGPLSFRADEVMVHLRPDPTATRTGPMGGGILSGTFGMLECKGRIEIDTQTHIVHCDSLTYDLNKRSVRLSMKKNTQSIKMYEVSTKKKRWSNMFFQIRHRAVFNSESGAMKDSLEDGGTGSLTNIRGMRVKPQAIPQIRPVKKPILMRLNEIE